MKTGFLITARLKSKRLPKKVIKKVLGKPLIVHMIDRIKTATCIKDIVLCTSTNPQDDPLESISYSEGIKCYRGSESDVLVRLFEAATEHQMEHFVSLTADCPLVDPFFIDLTVRTLKRTNVDLVTYQLVPDGQYGVKTKALQQICEEKDEIDTECWSGYFTESNSFQVYYADTDVDPIHHHKTLRTTLDYQEDYDFIKQVFEEIYSPNHVFSLLDIIHLVQRKPELLSINADCAKRCIEHVKSAAPVKWKNQKD